MKLSVCVLAHNEEQIIRTLLESIKEADEIVINANGCTDKTVDICKEYTDKVFTDYKWIDNFADARNWTIKKATGDWVLFMDADWVLNNTIEEVKQAIAGDAVAVKLKAWSGGFHFLPVLFKRGLTYSGKVHEAISPTDKRQSNLEITYYQNKNRKPDRNLKILLTMEKTPRTLFYLAKEYFDLANYEKAIETFDSYLEVSTWLEERAEAYYYKALSLWRLSKGTEAREVNFEAIKINPDMKKALLLASEMHYEPWKSKWLYIASNAKNTDVLFQ